MLAPDLKRSSHEVSRLLRLLSGARAACGTCDDFMLLLTILSRSLLQSLANEWLDADLAPAGAALPSLGTNVRSLAQSIGIPKETVRRKCAAFRSIGWVVQHDRGLSCTGAALRDVPALRALLFEDQHSTAPEWLERRPQAAISTPTPFTSSREFIDAGFHR